MFRAVGHCFWTLSSVAYDLVPTRLPRGALPPRPGRGEPLPPETTGAFPGAEGRSGISRRAGFARRSFCLLLLALCSVVGIGGAGGLASDGQSGSRHSFIHSLLRLTWMLGRGCFAATGSGGRGCGEGCCAQQRMPRYRPSNLTAMVPSSRSSTCTLAFTHPHPYVLAVDLIELAFVSSQKLALDATFGSGQVRGNPDDSHLAQRPRNLRRLQLWQVPPFELRLPFGLDRHPNIPALSRKTPAGGRTGPDTPTAGACSLHWCRAARNAPIAGCWHRPPSKSGRSVRPSLRDVHAGVPLHQLSTVAPSRPPLVHLYHVTPAGSPQPCLRHPAP
jgi:hypothetical protein